jgi:hypothetical protein
MNRVLVWASGVSVSLRCNSSTSRDLAWVTSCSISPLVSSSQPKMDRLTANSSRNLLGVSHPLVMWWKSGDECARIVGRQSLYAPNILSGRTYSCDFCPEWPPIRAQDGGNSTAYSLPTPIRWWYGSAASAAAIPVPRSGPITPAKSKRRP